MKQLILISFLLLFFIINGLAQNKGGRWQFENNATDSASWDVINNDGVLIDSALYSQDVPLQEGASYLWLDTTYNNNFFKVEDSDDLDFTDENIGLSAWIYPIRLDDTQFFINKGIQNTNPKSTNYSLRVSKSRKLEFLIRDAANQAKKVGSSFSIPQNQWTFVAAYYDFSAQKVYMWNDPLNDAVDSLDFNQSFFANDGPLGIGAWYADDENNPAVAAFKGRIDDVRISGNKEDILPGAVTSTRFLEMNKITSFELRQNYPNPFNPKTVISFYLPKTENVTLKVYDNQGKIVDTLLDRDLAEGNHKYTWDASPFSSGIYFYQLKSNNLILTKKMFYIK